MAAHIYECLFLLDPNKASADWDALHQSLMSLIEHHGGEVLVSRPWGEPKLAYPIGKFRKGTYLLTYFRCEARKIPELERDCRLHDAILRHMVLKLHTHIAEGILAHLRGETEAEPAPEPAGAAR